MLIEYTELSQEALKGIAEAYVLTQFIQSDDGIQLEQWTDEVMTMVKQKKLLVEYSEVNESVYLIQAEST